MTFVSASFRDLVFAESQDSSIIWHFKTDQRQLNSFHGLLCTWLLVIQRLALRGMTSPKSLLLQAEHYVSTWWCSNNFPKNNFPTQFMHIRGSWIKLTKHFILHSPMLNHHMIKPNNIRSSQTYGKLAEPFPIMTFHVCSQCANSRVLPTWLVLDFIY